LALLLAVWSRLMLEHVLSLSLVCDANTNLLLYEVFFVTTNTTAVSSS
jgi:hypothetical protein